MAYGLVSYWLADAYGLQYQVLPVGQTQTSLARAGPDPVGSGALVCPASQVESGTLKPVGTLIK